MKDFKKAKLLWLVISLLLLAMGLAAAYLAFYYGRRLSYIPMTVCTGFSVIGLYGAVFSYRKRVFICACERLVQVCNLTGASVLEISEGLGIKEKTIVKIINKGRRQGYIPEDMLV